MSQLTKQALKVENTTAFPNNNAGLITPTNLRTFNENMIDSTVNQEAYTTDSASFDSRINAITGSSTNTGSLLETASFDNNTRNLTFTKGDDTQFSVNIPDSSGSILPSGVVSGSSQVILQSTTGNLSGSRIDGSVLSATSASYALTASYALNVPAINTGSFATTGSNTFNGVQTIKSTNGTPLILDHSDASPTQNTLLAFFKSGSAEWSIGNLGTDDSFVLYNPNTFQSPISVAQDNSVNLLGALNANSVSASTINGLGNPTTFSQSVDSRLDAFEAVSSSYARTDVNNTFGGTQNFLNIAVAGTASIAYLQSVTGSAKIIGDAFIVLNNDTPTERYAGIIVQDSGSTTTTASFEFDGQTNDWFYDYTTDGGITTDYGVALFGPEYNTKGNPTYLTNNKIPKSIGSHHLNDSSIYDDGTNVSIGANLSVTGSISTNGSSVLTATDLTPLNSFTSSQEVLNNKFATTGSNTFVDKQIISANGIEITGSVNLTPLSVSANGNFPIPFISASIVSKDSVDTLVYNPTTNQLIVSASTGQSQISPNSIGFTSGSGQYGTYGSTLSKTGYTSIIEGSGYVGVSGNPSKIGAPSLTTSTNPGILALSGSGQPYVAIEFQPSASFTDGRVTIKRPLIAESGITITGNATLDGSGLVTNAQTASLENTSLNAFTASQETTNTQLLNASSSFAEKFATIGTQSGSWGGGSGGGFPYTGSAEITGSLGITGSFSGYVNTLGITSNTASLNFNDGNFFTLQLVGGATTHLTATNVRPGQTINLLVKSDVGLPANSGSLTFSPTFKFAGGFDYTPTAITGSQDLVSFVTFDTTQIFTAQVKNLS